VVEWGIRALLAVGAAVAGYVSLANTLAYALKGSPARAHVLAPNDGRVTARLSQQLLTAETTKVNRGKAEQAARLALKQDPTAVRAVATLGLSAQLRGDATLARRLFAYAQALSRRELQTQLWAIEDAVGRDDVPGVLKHYDIALRTSKTAPDLLFPVLASAVSDPAIRTALVKTLAPEPGWSESFIAYVTSHGPDPRSTAALFLGLRRVGVVVPESARAPVIHALIAGGLLDEAWRYYASARPGADRRASRDPQFVIDTQSPSLFDWVPVNDGSVTTSIQRSEGGGVFDFAAPASVGGSLLQQMQLLPPGTYRIVGHSSGIEQETGARPYWALSCRQDGRELGRVPLPNSTQAGGRFIGNFAVPANCPVQMLTLVAPPSNALAGLSGQIDRVQLAPVP
jgi:hypothetical protein